MDAITKADTAANAIPGFFTSSAGRLAIVTGGCSGMGLAFATRAASCGMIPCVLDMDTASFPNVEKELRAAGAPDVFTAKADVSSMDELAKIAGDIAAKFSAATPIGIICANAGYAGPTILGGTPKQITKQIDVLTMGVIWTIKAFQEKFLSQKEPCAIVGTSSVAGILTSDGAYGVGKHGCLAVMESLHEELARNKNAKHVTTHVLCPGAVATNFFAKTKGSLAKMKERAQPPSHLAMRVWEAVESGRFYIIVDGETEGSLKGYSEEMMKLRHRRIEEGAPPPSREAMKARMEEINSGGGSNL